MAILDAIKNRHSVRSYTDKPISIDMINELNEEISICNKKGGLHIQLAVNEPEAFSGWMAHYGKFRGVRNYIALIGEKEGDLDERIGYYGEHLALKAQEMGLNTCWVAMSFSRGKSRCTRSQREKLVCVLSLGYGENQGVPHKGKSMEQLCCVTETMPVWFKDGMEAAMLAPTAMNQQKFMFTLLDNQVTAKATGGFYSKVDLGIVKYHFEIGSGKMI